MASPPLRPMGAPLTSTPPILRWVTGSSERHLFPKFPGYVGIVSVKRCPGDSSDRIEVGYVKPFHLYSADKVPAICRLGGL